MANTVVDFVELMQSRAPQSPSADVQALAELLMLVPRPGQTVMPGVIPPLYWDIAKALCGDLRSKVLTVLTSGN